MGVPDGAPPLAIYCSPYGGLGLKTKRFPGARARIAGLLVGATEVEQDTAELAVREPCQRDLLEALVGPLEPDVAMRSGGAARDLAAAVVAAGHVHDAVAGEAWQRFGAPTSMQANREARGFGVTWCWTVADDLQRAPQQLDAWTPFAAAYDQLMVDDYATVVHVRCAWSARLRVAAGRVVEDPYPPSSIHAHLRGRHASAFLDIVLPHEAQTEAFFADYEAINAAIGMTIPLRGYKLCTPKKRGRGRAFKRLPEE
jgi:hypothetical protein